ncbi:hypothetical protein BB560_004802 [Smittium megazygosporum]|uniref:Charged multivesicular body protein 7 n=1 Tax=Smittium megazygosporum TaxID=133381 RepID=A0A2T9Z878_9FUNG|nr:hypothetical protein BB560_004802 [Smittium megazygosporum]
MALSSFLLEFKELADPDLRSAFYSDLSLQKTENPSWYEQSIQQWLRIISSCTEHGYLSSDTASNSSNNPKSKDSLNTLNESYADLNYTCFETAGLESKFIIENDSPTSMQEIITELLNRNELLVYSDYINRDQISTLSLLFSWMFSSKKNSLNNSTNNKIVVLSLVKKFSERILETQKQNCVFKVTDNLMTNERFCRIFYSCLNPVKISGKADSSKRKISETDYRAIIAFLEKNGHVTVGKLSSEKDIEIIRFTDSISNKSPISLLDIKVVDLLLSEENVSKQILHLENRVSENREKVGRALEKKNKAMAISTLKYCKHIENEILPLRYKARDLVVGIITQIQNTSSDADHLAAIKSGTEALTLLQKSSGITADTVVETFEELAEVLAGNEEIQTTLQTENEILANRAGQTDSAVLEEELNAELDKIILEMKSETEYSYKPGKETSRNISKEKEIIIGNKKQQSVESKPSHKNNKLISNQSSDNESNKSAEPAEKEKVLEISY